MAKRVRQGTLAQVGRHLRMLRTALGHSQQDWAYALQITPQVLNKWESGKRQPNIEVLFRICDSFGCSLDFIFRGKMRASVRDISPELQAKLIAVYGDAFCDLANLKDDAGGVHLFGDHLIIVEYVFLEPGLFYGDGIEARCQSIDGISAVRVGSGFFRNASLVRFYCYLGVRNDVPLRIGD